MTFIEQPLSLKPFSVLFKLGYQNLAIYRNLGKFSYQIFFYVITDIPNYDKDILDIFHFLTQVYKKIFEFESKIMKFKSYLMKHKRQIGTQGLIPNAVSSTEEFYNDWTT